MSTRAILCYVRKTDQWSISLCSLFAHAPIQCAHAKNDAITTFQTHARTHLHRYSIMDRMCKLLLDSQLNVQSINNIVAVSPSVYVFRIAILLSFKCFFLSFRIFAFVQITHQNRFAHNKPNREYVGQILRQRGTERKRESFNIIDKFFKCFGNCTKRRRETEIEINVGWCRFQ